MAEWTESLSVGVPKLDEHHRHLFHLLDRIDGLAEAGLAQDDVRSVFDELNNYIAYHFSEEEAMMERAGFPFLDLHRHSHQTIAMRVAEMSATLSVANVERVVRELHDFLAGWLVHHIEIEDFEYRPFMTGGQ
ncbi:Hemerythrin [Paramagnetospirillum magnetotacticum MS-1]|uniref:Hemerythrin n=1 Tax=Paramagnetospirillum magnetotacticum MS-1 TaxID=272627 RepID=A0A0C2YZA2_PARME|nr:hemerythrin family protein [Paramagnetospirillum magnetotacticum]KIL99985.1 Hemerythrin [Paramagnetospirillum magnetotacticum MS-1]